MRLLLYYYSDRLRRQCRLRLPTVCTWSAQGVNIHGMSTVTTRDVTGVRPTRNGKVRKTFERSLRSFLLISNVKQSLRWRWSVPNYGHNLTTLALVRSFWTIFLFTRLHIVTSLDLDPGETWDLLAPPLLDLALTMIVDGRPARTGPIWYRTPCTCGQHVGTVERVPPNCDLNGIFDWTKPDPVEEDEEEDAQSV